MANSNNVDLIDPNLINVNTGLVDGVPFVNGIPQYQDMYIFVELVAESKGRSVIITSNQGSNIVGQLKTGLETDRTANFMGVNQDNTNNNPNYLNFTTNYYDGSTGDRLNFESFGITNIKITTNSSYVPQVNIQFTDIRGLSFFNEDASPYRMLFDFPPPVFALTVKGYYGKALTYKLHLVKYTSEFSDTNGNFVIDAEFIAQTFAPLTDVLFRYVVNVPLIDGGSLNPDTKTKPTNTYELMMKVRNLYSIVDNKINTSSQTQEYDSSKDSVDEINEVLGIVNNYKNDEILKTYGKPYLFYGNEGSELIEDISTNSNNSYFTINSINSLNEYDQFIKELPSSTIPEKIEKRLFVGYVIDSNIENSDNTKNATMGSTISNSNNSLELALNGYALKLIPSTASPINLKASISEKDIRRMFSFFGNRNLLTGKNINTKYASIDITNYYYKLYKYRTKSIESKRDLANEIGRNVNNTINEELGMNPTIYNIFEIILNDVDIFFNKLHDVSIKAETSHNNSDIKKILQGSIGEDVNKIYAFPLVVDQTNVCGGIKEERVSPLNISKENNINFPELDFVNKFIQTFQQQARYEELYNMRNEQNADGSNVWIPISPIDSSSGGASSQSPYIGIDGFGGSASINESTDSRLLQILEIVLRRFYILSEGIIPFEFYRKEENNRYVEFFSISEALNLAESLTNDEYIENIKTNIKNFSGNINSFYQGIKDINFNVNDKTFNAYNFTESDAVDYFPITKGKESDGLVYVDKYNIGFKGCEIYRNNLEVQAQTDGGDNSKPINKFIDNVKGNFFQQILGLSDDEAYFEFTNENVQYIRDKLLYSDDDESYDGIDFQTRFLCPNGKGLSVAGVELISGVLSDVKNNKIDDLLNNGNVSMAGKKLPLTNKQKLSLGSNMVEIWVDNLSEFSDVSKYDNKLYEEFLSQTNSKLTALIILSNFGYTLSPFNVYPSNLNYTIFNNSYIINVPIFVTAYIGAIVNAINDPVFMSEIVDFFDNGLGKEFETGGKFIFADMYDIKEYLSENDKVTFANEFEDFFLSNGFYSVGGFSDIIGNLNELYDKVNDDRNKGRGTYEELYDQYLNPNNENTNAPFFIGVISPLLERINIMNYSQLSFRMTKSYATYYQSINTLINNGFKQNLDKYFIGFFNRLYEEIIKNRKEIEEKNNEQNKILGDKDIINQMYYSFKNINDKWLTNSLGNVGFPFNNGKKLIDSFVFVDRAMNPIGDTMINAEILIDLFNDPNISVYSALSQILSTNGFEFFPLQNFMNYKKNGVKWEDSFKIDTSGEMDSQIAFVCMYIGGGASYPATSNNDFKDDGIVDLNAPGVADFSTDDNCYPTPDNDKQVENNPNFSYRDVKAFRVRFGEQNQSMFTKIKIDSKEYPETNESIQILSRLAGDNKLTSPVPKGQNLYNLYENRSYKATITSMGNAMIQPTQYFQLENVPMFNGAYIILDVEHTIEPNKMMTTFSGTKILKYPIPRVTNPVVFVGLDDISEDRDFNDVVVGSAPIDLSENYQISKHLTLYDTIAQGTSISGDGAKRRGLSNMPNEIELQNIIDVAKNIYDPVRDYIGHPIYMHSFYRGRGYSQAMINEGTPTSLNSQHVFGYAVDMDLDVYNNPNLKNSDMFYYIVNNLLFDQIIWEKGNGINPDWVHASYKKTGNRGKISIYYRNRNGSLTYKHFFGKNSLPEFEAFKRSIYD